MPRRMGRPGLVGTMARTAVVAGTATAVVGGVQGHQQKKQQAAADQQAANQAAYESQAGVADLQSQMGSGAEDITSQLTRLGELHANGVLTDAEFATAKAKLLA